MRKNLESNNFTFHINAFYFSSLHVVFLPFFCLLVLHHLHTWFLNALVKVSLCYFQLSKYSVAPHKLSKSRLATVTTVVGKQPSFYSPVLVLMHHVSDAWS